MTSRVLRVPTWRSLGPLFAEFARRDVQAAALLALVTLAVRLIPAWWLDAIVHDVAVYFTMSQYVLRGDNIYAQRVLFPYMPFSQFHPALAQLLSQWLGWSFDFAVKLPEIVTDACATLVIFGFQRATGARMRTAVAWTLLWALSPVSILISAFHGNIMASVPFFVLGAFVAAERARTSPHRPLLLVMSGLMLGIGIALRTYPILMLPLFVLLACRSVREAVLFLACAAFPGVASAIPYLLFARQTFLAEVLGYGGFTDFGWVSVLRTIPFLLGTSGRMAYFGGLLLDITRNIFVYGYCLMLLAAPVFRTSSLGKSLAIMPLMFYGLYAGVGAQYLVWVIPIGIAIRDRWVIAHSAAATLALLGFYSWYAPAILFGRHAFPPLDEHALALIYVIGNTLIVCISLAWLIRIVAAEFRAFARRSPTTEFAPVAWLKPLWSHPVYWLALTAAAAIVLLPLGWQALVAASDVMRAALPTQYHIYLPRLG